MKSGQDYLAGQSQPLSEEAKEKQQAFGELKLPGTSASGTKQKRSMKEDEASLRIRKKIPIPPLPSKLPPKNILVTTEETKILTQTQRRLMMDKVEMSLESPGKKIPSGGTYPPEPLMPLVFAPWYRIAARAGKMKTVASPQEAQGVKWCMVHGRSMSADTQGWVHLQFHAGQGWVPEKRGRVCALFLLSACNFLPPQQGDNMLCPKCVRRNKVLMKSLQ
ncbi:unnamed protein product [Nyctereutes procyonoides]|uniref:(raccoon dog) hypothetical protein n=1 Tax=Nyctereutes procyonoides TaxID=34880 RepID=A0A811ZAB2_NYCPR|nr:unnamed protein product [Nyctereutes procyonoides]